ncbi:hypothetical protein M9H77_10348 [Catharanthus roseus]|uniref:Uncharacterized protein n=1 Tax=Catharanthus roseus TaxID=4058 RepID=A0ACC0C3M9_CATRO|nr:hypothetical protein M9H77_10348 [Catharanthus roseus]
MSGVTLAVAPRSDPEKTTVPGTKPESKKPQPSRTDEEGIMGSLRLIELQLVAFIMVFSASGLVPLLDLIFPAFTSAYILALSRFVFPSRGRISGSREIFRGMGLFLPLAYVLGGFARGDEHAVRSATPHLFLLSFQILTENIISGLSLFSPPARALVPLLYTTRRLFIILDWTKDVWINKTLPANADLQNVAWYWFGRVLAVANLVYFSINLFGFLIPRFLPRAFENYFREKDEIQTKMEQDKRFSAAINNRSSSSSSSQLQQQESASADKKAD